MEFLSSKGKPVLVFDFETNMVAVLPVTPPVVAAVPPVVLLAGETTKVAGLLVWVAVLGVNCC